MIVLEPGAGACPVTADYADRAIILNLAVNAGMRPERATLVTKHVGNWQRQTKRRSGTTHQITY